MEAGISDHVWSLEEVEALLDVNVKPMKRGPYRKISMIESNATNGCFPFYHLRIRLRRSILEALSR